MEYTIQRLGALAGISTRALRYYDEIGILKPARINSSGYRIYGQTELDRLQHILFYRELDFGLEQIQSILADPSFDRMRALKDHQKKLLEKRNQLDTLLATLEKTIASSEGRLTMNDQEKFAGFKQKMIDDNEEKYGEEIRQKYGDDAINQSNEKLKKMTKEDYDQITELANQIKETLAKAFQTGDPASDVAQKAVDLHKQWLTFYWNGYSKEAHAGLGQMYVEDERFRAYYDVQQPGTAAFLRDAILIYTKK